MGFIIVGVKSVVTDRYLRPTKDASLLADGKGDPQMYLEKASVGTCLYHIKSHETNKYWQVKFASDPWITADADAINENPKNPACTMFQIDYFATPDTTNPADKPVRLLHENLKCYACIQKAGDNYCLSASSKIIGNDSKDAFVCESFN